jgi:hypothetical protein
MTISAVGKKGSGRLTVIINVPTKGEACERITIYEVHMFLDLLKGSADREYRMKRFVHMMLHLINIIIIIIINHPKK